MHGRILNLKRMSWAERSEQSLRDRGIVLIDRRSKWGNPFHIHPFQSRAQAIAKHRQWLWQQIVAGKVTIEELAELADKDLACWCTPLACHGQTLREAALWAQGVVDGKLDPPPTQTRNAYRLPRLRARRQNGMR